MKLTQLAAITAALVFSAATAAANKPILKDPYPSTYRALASVPTLIRNATILTGTGERIDGGQLLLQDGKIQAIGKQLDAPADAQIIDAQGKWVSPGIIDVHSHLGVYPSPGATAHQDGNEITNPITAQVWAEHSVWPQDEGFNAARAGGVTSMMVLPGSANLIGGRGVTLKNIPARSYQAMKFPNAPWGLKMACGENPKRVYGGRGTAPGTRMGNVAGYRNAYIEAREYLKSMQAAQTDDSQSTRKKRKKSAENGAKPPKQDLRLETLAAAMNGEIKVQIHCYRADEMMTMIDLSKEFGFQISAFHHGVEAYKIADKLAEEKICGALWADWWGFKMEAYDGIQENILMVDKQGKGCAVVHSDSSEGIQRLHQDAGKVIGQAQRIGMDVSPDHAIRWITSNAAHAIGIDEMTGSLEVGKMADVVLWSQNPFSVYAKAEKVWVDGALTYDQKDPGRQATSDFMLGQELAQ